MAISAPKLRLWRYYVSLMAPWLTVLGRAGYGASTSANFEDLVFRLNIPKPTLSVGNDWTVVAWERTKIPHRGSGPPL
jgi:hypothetical protein